jgi:GT2 family glycosyltransferase
MISVVIPSYNRRDCVLNLLKSVYLQREVEFEVIVVDDCSPDDTVEAVRREFPQVSLLVNERNAGPCVTRNRGVRAARGEWIVGLDSDVTLPDPLLLAKTQRTFSEYPTVNGLAFRLLKPDGHSEDTARWWHPLPIGDFATKRFLTSYFSGTGYAFRKQAMMDAGLYPEILYMHYEEVELALRILDQGGSIMHCPDIAVLHHANDVSRRSEVHVYYKPRNQILLAVACYPFWQGVAYVLPRVAYQFSMAAKDGHFADFTRAMKDAVTTSRAILPTRCPLQTATFKKIRHLRKGLIA